LAEQEGTALSHLWEALGYKPLTRSWAKVELLLGLLAAGVGIYLALAGHRSHLYQSGNEMVEEIYYLTVGKNPH
jgi:hypothetical protein